MARANDVQMDELHGALCGYFLKLIGGHIPELVKETRTSRDANGAEVVTSEWVETGLMIRPGAGDLAVMAKFLKDNAVTGAIVEGSALSTLEQQLAAKHKRSGRLPTVEDAQRALDEVGSKLLN